MEQIYETEDTDPRSAFDSLVKYAEVCGNADALYRLGAAYAHPDEDVFDIKEDQEKAFHYYDMAIAKGHDTAMFQRGFPLVDAATGPCNRREMWCWEGPLSEAQEKQVERGTHLLELAAEKGNACALSMLGCKYKGRDEEKSFHFFQRAVLADQAEFTVSEMQSFDMHRGHADDLYELGKMYRYGRGTGVDEEKCLRFYEQAAALGHGEALDDLGEAYEYGHLGKEVNIETSIKYYEKSVEADPGPWADIIEKYGNVRTFVLGEERGEWTDTEDEDEIDIEDKATGSKGKGSDQSSSHGKCAGEDEADKDEVNSEDEASGSKGNGSEQSSPCRKCAGEDKGEGEGDSGESGPLILIRKGTLVIDMTLATEDEKKSQRDWLARCYGADQPSPSASGQPSSQDADPNAATMPSFDGYTDSAKVVAIITELRDMGCDVPNENEIQRELRKAKGNQQQAIEALTATS